MSHESMMEATARISFGTSSTDTSYTAPPPQTWRLGISQQVPRLPCEIGKRRNLVDLCVDRTLDVIHDYRLERFPRESGNVLPLLAKRWRERMTHAKKSAGTEGDPRKLDASTEFVMMHLLGEQEGSSWTNLETVPINEILHYCLTSQSPLCNVHQTITPSTTFDLITTLNLSYNYFLSDGNILSIRALSHLSFLFTAGTDLTDDGVSRLAMSLYLPGGRTDNWTGPWRLRGWFLDGSGKITDKGVKSFGKWPMLNILGLDRTSVTPAGLQILRSLTPKYGPAWHINKSTIGPTARLYRAITPEEGPDKRLAHQEWHKLSTAYRDVWPRGLQGPQPARSDNGKNNNPSKPIFTLNVRAGPPTSVDRPIAKQSRRLVWSSTPGAGLLYSPGVDLNRDAPAEPDEYDRTPFRPDPDREYDGPSEERQNRYGRGVGNGRVWKGRSSMVVKGHWSTVEMAVVNTLVREPPTLEDLNAPNHVERMNATASSGRSAAWVEPSKNPFGLVKTGSKRPAISMASLGLVSAPAASSSSASQAPRPSLGSSFTRMKDSKKRSWNEDESSDPLQDSARKRPSPFASQKKPAGSARSGFGLFQKL